MTFVGSELALALQKQGTADAHDKMDTTEEGGHGLETTDADFVRFTQMHALQKALVIARILHSALRECETDNEELERVGLAGISVISMCKEIHQLQEDAIKGDELLDPLEPSFDENSTAIEKGLEMADMFSNVAEAMPPLRRINFFIYSFHADIMGRSLSRMASQQSQQSQQPQLDATDVQDQIHKLEKMNEAQHAMNTAQQAQIASQQAEIAALQAQLRVQQDITALSAQKKIPHASSDTPAAIALKKDVRFANLPKLPVLPSKPSKTLGYMKGTSAADARNRGTDVTGQIQRPWTPKVGDRRKKATSPSSPPLQAAKKLKMVADVEADKARAVTMEVGKAIVVNLKVRIESAAKAKAEEAEAAKAAEKTAQAEKTKAAKAAEKAKGGGSVKGSGSRRGRGRGRGRGSGGE